MNKKNTILGLAIFMILGVAAITVFGMQITYDNREIALREEAGKQLGVIEVTHDKMFKILQQKAGVTKEYRAGFDSIYTHIISGRYSQGDGSLMKWIQESNPEFDSSLYTDLMTSIEIERTEFLKAQTRVMDIMREHETLCKQAPGRWFISDTTPIVYTPISSSITKEVVETGVDDNIDLWN